MRLWSAKRLGGTNNSTTAKRKSQTSAVASEERGRNESQRTNGHLHQRKQCGKILLGRLVLHSLLEAQCERFCEQDTAGVLSTFARAQERRLRVVSAVVRGGRYSEESLVG